MGGKLLVITVLFLLILGGFLTMLLGLMQTNVVMVLGGFVISGLAYLAARLIDPSIGQKP